MYKSGEKVKNEKQFWENILFRANKLSLFGIFSQHINFMKEKWDEDNFFAWIKLIDEKIYKQEKSDNYRW